YMGCWGHDRLPMRGVRRLVPPQESGACMLAHRLGFRVALTDPERARLTAGVSLASLTWETVRYAIKNAGFYTALGVEMTVRYTSIVRSRRPLVLSDRWIQDLEFRQGRAPFARGQRFRCLCYRFFPAPDGVVYLSTPYALVEKRKPQLDRARFEA